MGWAEQQPFPCSDVDCSVVMGWHAPFISVFVHVVNQIFQEWNRENEYSEKLTSHFVVRHFWHRKMRMLWSVMRLSFLIAFREDSHILHRPILHRRLYDKSSKKKRKNIVRSYILRQKRKEREKEEEWENTLNNMLHFYTTYHTSLQVKVMMVQEERISVHAFPGRNTGGEGYTLDMYWVIVK